MGLGGKSEEVNDDKKKRFDVSHCKMKVLLI
jgi:hypothetical protein